MQIQVNGQLQELPSGQRLLDLLAQMQLAGKRVAVEHNGEIVPRSQHGECVLQAGDQLEIVVAVGGG